MLSSAPSPEFGSLADRIISFNLMPVENMHESWFDALPHFSALREAADADDAKCWLSSYALDVFGLKGRYWCDFQEPRTRLALLDNESTQEISLYVGLVLRSAEIRNEVHGALVKKWRAELGDNAMKFAVRRAPLMGDPPQFNLGRRLEKTKADTVLLGAAFCLDAAAVADDAFVKRYCLKLPRQMEAALQKAIKARRGPAVQDVVPRLVSRIVREITPQWLPLFN